MAWSLVLTVFKALDSKVLWYMFSGPKQVEYGGEVPYTMTLLDEVC